LAKHPGALAREAERDQDQVVEMPGIGAWDTGDYRTTQADRWRFPASARLQGKRAFNMDSCYVLIKGHNSAPGPDPNRVGTPAIGVYAPQLDMAPAWVK
jgi:hypothetical protein